MTIDPPLTLDSRGDATLVLDDAADLDAFAAFVNQQSHLAGLADELNPRIVDAAKLRAFIAALAAQPVSVRTALAGHTLTVDTSGLGVLQLEPTTPESFAGHYQLAFDRYAGIHVLLHASFTIDPALAQTRVAAAKKAVVAADKAVKHAEGGATDPDGLDLGALRFRRSQAAKGWSIAAHEWKVSQPANADAQQAAAEAKKAALAYDMPSGGAM